jgi:hypothetical protein
MRHRKIRGHKRRHKQIDHWVLDNISIDNLPLHRNKLLLRNQNRYHVKIDVDPWCRIPVINSEIPEPTGKTKQKILNGLLEIYENWKIQLDKLNESYYLKIWLFEPRFSQSQVVFAIGEDLNFYENVFYKPETHKSIKLENYGSLQSKIAQFDWDYYLDEEQNYDNDVKELLEQKVVKKWFQKLLKKPYRKIKYDEPFGEITGAYFFEVGDIWVGGKK